MPLHDVWFALIAILFTGYFVLEGFDFGVGMLVRLLARGDKERRVLINTIGPVWDGNEVWVITAGGAMFASFPEWYASLFSGFYLPLLLILAGLIVRGVAFEYRGTRDDPAWRNRWDWCIFLGSLVPAVAWGVVFGNIVRGVALDAAHEYAGTPADLLNPYALLGGATMLVLFLTHGAIFAALKTTGEIRLRANRFAFRAGLGAVAAAAGFLAWTLGHRFTAWSAVLAVAAALALAGGLLANRAGREGWAFTGTALAVGLAVLALFANLYPAVLPSTIADANSLTVDNASSTPYTLKIMTWVFRKRIGTGNIPDTH